MFEDCCFMYFAIGGLLWVKDKSGPHYFTLSDSTNILNCMSVCHSGRIFPFKVGDHCYIQDKCAFLYTVGLMGEGVEREIE